ncbi:hypothetical protein CU024_0504 [Enterococcus faecium]|nr:hypothetical protein EfmE1039_1904 [Enterococcus faecium E1039]EFF38421.1 hypothetical protein EfmE980_0474 [Enterococcus faecium E980]MBK4757015.1 hypothetical protein [Enterococcus faecium]MBL4991523.1 hypothetical protein [Enterococcus lactis]MBK4762984.1 hypothetical protein [Enterococcus faecium]
MAQKKVLRFLMPSAINKEKLLDHPIKKDSGKFAKKLSF